jgi:TP901 family phage tail tape measure protein
VARTPEQKAVIKLEMRTAKMQRELRTLSNRFGRFNRTVKGTARGMGVAGRATNKLGSSFNKLALGLLGVGGAVYAVHKFRQGLRDAASVSDEFEKQMARVHTIVRGSTGEWNALQGAVLGLSSTMIASPVEVAGGLYQAMSAQVGGAADSVNFLRAAIQLNIGGFADMEEVVKTMSAVLHSYNLEADDAGIISDKLFKTVELGITEMPLLANTLGMVVGSYAAMGGELEELLALISVMTRTMPTAIAVTAINSTLTTMTNLTDEAKAVLEKYEIEVDAARIKNEGLLPILVDIGNAFGDDADALREVIPEQRAFRLVAQAMGETTIDIADAQYKLQDAFGASGRAMEIVRGTMYGINKQFESTRDVLKIIVLKALEPFRKTFILTLTQMVEKLILFASSQEGVEKITFAVASALRQVVDAVGWVGRAIIKVTGGFQKFRKSILEARKELLHIRSGFVGVAISALELIQKITKPWAEFQEDLAWLPRQLGLMSDAITTATGTFEDNEQTLADLRKQQDGYIDRILVLRKTILGLGEGTEEAAKAFELFMSGAYEELDKFLTAAEGRIPGVVAELRAIMEELRKAQEGAAAPVRPPAVQFEVARPDILAVPEAEELVKKTKRVKTLALEVGSQLGRAFGRGRKGIDELGRYFKEQFIQNIIGKLLGKALNMALGGASVGSVAEVVGLQHGGLVTGPTLAALAERGKPELVLPLDRLGAFVDRINARRGGQHFSVHVSGATAETQVAIIEDDPRASRRMYRNVVRPQEQIWHTR